MENKAQKYAVKSRSDPGPDPTRPDPRIDPIRVHLWSVCLTVCLTHSATVL